MNKYKIEYIVMGTGAPAPLIAYIDAYNEDLARIAFFVKRDFYNTNNPDKVVIESIRICQSHPNT